MTGHIKICIHIQHMLIAKLEVNLRFQAAFGGVGTEGGGISYVFNPFEATYTYIIGQSSQDAGSTTPATPAKSNGVLKML